MNTKNNHKHIRNIGGSLVLILVIVLAFSSCAPSKVAETELSAAPTEAAVETSLPTVLPTEAATVLPEPTLEPSPTATPEPTAVPSNTPVPAVELIDEGIEVWAIPQGAAVVTSISDLTPDSYRKVAEGYVKNDVMNLKVPSSSIVVEAHFNQAIPNDAQLKVYSFSLPSGAWYTAPITPAKADDTTGVFVINHNAMNNPPFWEITYHLKLEGAEGKVYWEQDLRLFKALPDTCWDGSLPHPVTLYCPNTDGDLNFNDYENFNPAALP
ncbi:MAG: hypothetical protein CVU39_06410 [Chloroflexi bacterium HGW-Chloroflexi-10]|nr:MAG: hypothetical protein CVU39_06410 [Chloroflexi bacterium HGW-Chloroflexi-10]